MNDDAHIPAHRRLYFYAPGLMHACGHDAHTSTGLAVAHWFADHRDEMNGKIKILFQPAEEGVRGAAGMAASGVVDDADIFLSSHIAMMCKSGEVSVNPYGFLCTTKLDVYAPVSPAPRSKTLVVTPWLPLVTLLSSSWASHVTAVA